MDKPIRAHKTSVSESLDAVFVGESDRDDLALDEMKVGTDVIVLTPELYKERLWQAIQWGYKAHAHDVDDSQETPRETGEEFLADLPELKETDGKLL